MRVNIFPIAAFAAACVSPGLPQPGGSGPVLAVGGGGTPPEAIAEGLRLARARFGTPVDVVVVPHASAREDRGVGSAEMWSEAGADSASVLSDDAEEARTQLAGAEIVWIGGGDQGALLDHLEGSDLVADVLSAHRRGAVVGGTSAGAAVLGSTTIAGSPDPGPYVTGAMPGRPGLGLVPGAIVDQHFAERSREGRLVTALVDASEAIGLGIGERTAAVVEGDRVRVLGEGVVIVLDARGLQREARRSAEPQHARGLRLDVAPTGEEFRLPRAADRLRP